MNVVIYARYSSHNQTEQSIEGQIAVCQEYAKRNNYTVVGEYIDRALTGTNDNRPQFQKMLEDSNKKFFNGVLVYQLDRFARNRYDSATNKAKLKKNGVRVFSAKENISDDASGVLMESVLEGMAEYYSVELSQKVKRGMKINAEKCQHNGGIPALGYKVDENKKYIIDEEQAEIVRKIFNMYIEGYTMAEIINYLNKNNFKTSYNHAFNKNSIRTILLNEKYVGTYIYGNIKIKNGIPRIIDDKTFNKVAEIMKKNKKAPARSKAKMEYLLTTKLFCGNCKEMMTGTCGTSRTKAVHYYYTCNGRREKKCKKKNVRKDYIENLVIELARSMLTDKQIDIIANNVYKQAKKEQNNSQIKVLEKNLKENEKQKQNLINSLRICEIDSVRKTIFDEIKKIEDELNKIRNQIVICNSPYLDISVEEIVFFLRKLRDGDVNDIRYRKVLITTFINKIYLYDDKLTIIFNAKENQSKTIKIPEIDKIEGSFLGNSGQPYNTSKHLRFVDVFYIIINNYNIIT